MTMASTLTADLRKLARACETAANHADKIGWIRESDAACIGATFIKGLAPHIDRVLQTIAYDAGLDHSAFSSVLSDAIEGDLLFELERVAHDESAPFDPQEEWGTLNSAQQGIGK